MSFLKRMFTSFYGTSVLSQSKSHKNHEPSEKRRYAQKTPGSIGVAKAPRNIAKFQQSVSKDKTDILDDLPTTTSLAEDESRGRQRSVRECTQEPNVIKHVGPFLPKSVESCGSSKPLNTVNPAANPFWPNWRTQRSDNCSPIRPRRYHCTNVLHLCACQRTITCAPK